MFAQQKELTHLSVLVTRPPPQGEILCSYISALKGHSIYLPTIEIIPCNISLVLADYDWGIFVSPQAVYQSVKKLISLPAQIAAIGEGTANALREVHLPVHAYPQKEWNSEGLLALSEFQNLAGQKIAIIKGEGGREILFEKLIERQAEVDCLSVYQRVLPKIESAKYTDLLRRNCINVVICTSNEGLQNLKILLQEAWAYLQNLPVIVISKRMQIKANELGFKKIIVAKNASHKAILKTLAKGIKI